MLTDFVSRVLEALLDEVGLPTLMQYLLAKTSQAQAQAILDAAYAGTRAAVDAEAKAILK